MQPEGKPPAPGNPPALAPFIGPRAPPLAATPAAELWRAGPGGGSGAPAAEDRADVEGNHLLRLEDEAARARAYALGEAVGAW